MCLISGFVFRQTCKKSMLHLLIFLKQQLTFTCKPITPRLVWEPFFIYGWFEKRIDWAALAPVTPFYFAGTPKNCRVLPGWMNFLWRFIPRLSGHLNPHLLVSAFSDNCIFPCLFFGASAWGKFVSWLLGLDNASLFFFFFFIIIAAFPKSENR